MQEEKDCLHDMNNKLSCILGTVTLIKRTPKCADCKVSDLLDSIYQAGLGMGDIISAWRGKTDAARSQQLTRLNLDEKFQEGSELHEKLLRIGKEMQLDVELKNRMSKGCSILAMPTIIESAKQFIANVLFNAKKANASRITIIAVENADYVAIHIMDNGDGMSAETLSCLGLSVASKTSTGEGTRIVQKLVLQEGGVVEWSSPGVGAGCCVTIKLTKYKEVI